jgi:hypothetical protein
MLALTIEIPDWLLNGDFWFGYFCGIFTLGVIGTIALAYLNNNFDPFG